MRHHCLVLLATAAAVLPAAASASSIVIRRDTVIPVVFDDTLSLRNSQPGDRFRAHVANPHDLPRDTIFEGRIAGIRDKRGNEPGAMELVFTDVTLPDGSHFPIDAVPVSLNDRGLRRDRDGRIVANPDYRKRGNDVLGGAVGGFILGSILHKQLEYTVLGTLAGILVAETDRSNNGDTVVSRGDRMGALLNRDLEIDSRNDWRGDRDQRPNDDGWRRDDGWNRDNRGGDPGYDQRRQDPPVRTEPVPPTTPRFDDREPQVRYGDADLHWDKDKPFRDGDTLFVPLHPALDQLDLRTADDYNADSKFIFIDGPDGYLRLDMNSRDAKLNGKTFQLSSAPVQRDGVVFVPIEALAQLAKDPVFVNGDRIEKRQF